MQVVIDGAYKAPREVNFWLGLILLQLVLMLSLTGYLLPWDQKGFWATKVATNIMGIVPVVGPCPAKYCHWRHGLRASDADAFFCGARRNFAGIADCADGRRTFICSAGMDSEGRRTEAKTRRPFWPDQVLKDAVACLAVVATVLFLIVRHRIFHAPGRWARNWARRRILPSRIPPRGPNGIFCSCFNF